MTIISVNVSRLNAPIKKQRGKTDHKIESNSLMPAINTFDKCTGEGGYALYD